MIMIYYFISGMLNALLGSCLLFYSRRNACFARIFRKILAKNPTFPFLFRNMSKQEIELVSQNTGDSGEAQVHTGDVVTDSEDRRSSISDLFFKYSERRERYLLVFGFICTLPLQFGLTNSCYLFWHDDSPRSDFLWRFGERIDLYYVELFCCCEIHSLICAFCTHRICFCACWEIMLVYICR